jgi:hypothetical protein
VSDARWFTVAGLIFDVIGVVLVWRYGLPAETNRSGARRFVIGQRRPWLAATTDGSRVGLALVILGFVLQLAGSWPRAH